MKFILKCRVEGIKCWVIFLYYSDVGKWNGYTRIQQRPLLSSILQAWLVNVEKTLTTSSTYIFFYLKIKYIRLFKLVKYIRLFKLVKYIDMI